VTLLPAKAPERAFSVDSLPENPAEMHHPSRAEWIRDNLPTGLVMAAVVWWLVFAAHNWGGRGPHAVSIGAVITLVALLACRPDRNLGSLPLGLAAVASLAAFAVAATAPSGWQGATIAAPYACVAWLTIAVAAEVRRREQSDQLVALAIVVATLLEFYGGWTAWHGGLNPRVPFSGTFYWYNQVAAFMIPGSVIGMAFWLVRRGPVAFIGLLAAMLGSIAVVYSTSRASLACLVLGLLAVLGLHLALAPSRRLALRALAGSAFVTAAVVLIAGPPFFPQRVSPFAGTASRATGQSLGQNGGYRLDFWRESLTVFTHHPLVGSGFRALASVATPLVPATWPKSPLAHNGYLQALSDGGLVLGVPVCLGAGIIAWLVLRQLVSAVRQVDVTATSLAVPIALGALLAHSFVDFDWSYASLFALSGALGGVVLGRSSALRRPTERAAGAPATRSAWIGYAFLAIGIATLALSAYTARTGEIHLSVVLHGALSGHGGSA
jgi:O-antigen ligase